MQARNANMVIVEVRHPAVDAVRSTNQPQPGDLGNTFSLLAAASDCRCTALACGVLTTLTAPLFRIRNHCAPCAHRLEAYIHKCTCM